MKTETKLQIHEAWLPTGVSLRCIERPGDGGETLLLLHGYSDSGRSFVPILPALPPELRVLAPDQRGHGDSGRPWTGYDMAQLAADAASLLDAAAAGRVTVVGHSMGSMVAQTLALAYPERVSRLVLVGATPYGGGATMKEMERDVDALVDPVPDAFVRAFQLSTLHRPIPEPVLEGAIAESLKLPARVWRAILDGILAFDVRERVHEITCPTLLVWGAHDAIFGRAEQDRLVWSIPGAELVVYDDAGHAPHWEQPERFARDVADFLARRA